MYYDTKNKKQKIMKTIAQQLNIKDFPFIIKDENDNRLYYENSDGFWAKREFDKNNNIIYYEDSDGFWIKREYDENNNKLYFEYSDGYWIKREFEDNKEVYYENSYGTIIDKRPKKKKSKKMKTIAQQLNIKEFPFIIKDKNGNKLYYENSNGYWYKFEFDNNNNEVYHEDSEGYWFKCEYDKNNNGVYYEDSCGKIVDNKPKKYTNGIVTIDGVDYELKEVKK